MYYSKYKRSKHCFNPTTQEVPREKQKYDSCMYPFSFDAHSRVM